jgi:N-methylhydantoinase A/oxoprolinase/acetone carboxylase beta subunit
MDSSQLGLGIDAGGTYTDAVVWSFEERKILAKAKSLTTHNDLVLGIRDVLGKLPPALLSQVRVTSLSTTLATNAVVEERGCKVGLIVLSPWDWTEEQVGHSPLINVPGAVSINGEILQPLDEAKCRSAARELIEDHHCEAIAVAGYATIRNPVLADRARQIIAEIYDVPVVCAHEVSRKINAIHGAQTAIANARLLPIIRSLLEAVKKALGDYGVSGKLMILKGDGTLVDESVARKRPVETILSGPAASVNGARVLTGKRDAVVVDIGGTTTDCAILSHGQVRVCDDGARVGKWVMGVDAIDVSTIGLGGDSRIDFGTARQILVGPQRSIPFAYLADVHNNVMDFLEKLDLLPYKQWSDASPLDVLVLVGRTRNDLTDAEKNLLDLLEEKPVPALAAAEALGLASYRLLPTKRLESLGIIRKASLTPTDILHVTGVFTRWNTDAAQKALDLFSVLYGEPPEAVIEKVTETITRRLFDEIVRREVSYETRHKISDIPTDWEFLLSKAFADDESSGLSVRISLRRPVVAVGAPAGALVPPVGNRLHCQVLIAPEADVANAVGAVAAQVRVRAEVLIRPNGEWGYVLHGEHERMQFADLEEATAIAKDIARKRAYERALEAGAQDPVVNVTIEDGAGTSSDGSQVFLRRRVLAVASAEVRLARRKQTARRA